MAVDSVNSSNNNAGLYAAGAAVVGGGAGAAAGYLTKPFLKDDAPTDSFTKKMNEKIFEILPDEQKEIAREIDKQGKEIMNLVENAKSVEELKNGYLSKVMKNFEGIDMGSFKNAHLNLADYFDKCGIDVVPENVIRVQNARNQDELRVIMSEMLDKQFAGKTIEEIKTSIKTDSQTMTRKIAKNCFEGFWDSSKKTFVNCEEGVGKAVKSAARSIQGKYAAIYGAIGAGVLGLGTLLCCAGKKEVPQQEKVDTQA